MKIKTPAEYIYNLIAQGEHQQQDFKFEISDARKIAKSLSAFSNTDGGRLLVGVKDNGKIAGVRSDEEIYMIEAAAKLYCQPQVCCEMHTHSVEGRTILEVIIPQGKERPYYAKEENGRYQAYLRIQDENILASPVHLKVWKMKQAPKGMLVRYSEKEEKLLDYLSTHDRISISQYCKMADIPRKQAIAILAGFIHFSLLEPFYANKKFFYRLAPEKKPEN